MAQEDRKDQDRQDIWEKGKVCGSSTVQKNTIGYISQQNQEEGISKGGNGNS